MSQSRIGVSLAAVSLLLGSAGAHAADAVAGKKFFRAQCALCHSAEASDNGGAQGPDLAGVFDRKAASNSGFSYTPALRASNLTWNAATLDTFLASPAAVVPGTAMVIDVPVKQDRENVTAYFEALKNGTYKDPGPPANAMTGEAPAEESGGPPKSGQDWKLDAPGRVHHISADQLPPPFDTRGARNPPKFVARPANASLKLPPGFEVNVFAGGGDLQNPRNMRLAPNGDILLAESNPGRIVVMRPAADGKTAASIETFAQGLDKPFGIALYPAGSNPRWLYVSEVNRVVRYAYTVGDTKARGVPEVVVAQIHPNQARGHITRDLAFSADGKRLFVAVGSSSNVASEMSRKTSEEIKAWERQHATGAAWDAEENRADVLEFDVAKPGPAKFVATGIRNCVGLTLQPATGALWCTVNERDMLGDDLVPDYSTRVEQGGFYGWPWFYLGSHEDPGYKGQRRDLAGKAIVPDVLYQAHSAPITMTFYPPMAGPNKGGAAFPEEYWGDAFVVMHGSWNRAFRTGHKVVRVRLKNGVPTGEYEDFMIGFITDEGDTWGRPAGSVVAADGALLISEDFGNIIYRIAYRR